MVYFPIILVKGYSASSGGLETEFGPRWDYPSDKPSGSLQRFE